MRLFGKKKDEELDEEELDEKELDRKIPSRKFKDLAPQNRKKRKEPVKPWGKPERVLVFVILSVTIFLSIILAISSRGIPGISLPTIGNFNFPNLNPFKEETIIIGGESGIH